MGLETIQDGARRGPPPPPREADAARASLGQVGWILGAAALGFALAAVFSGWLRLGRGLFLVPYLVAAGAFLEAYRRRNGIRVTAALGSRWLAGLAGALVAGAFLVWSVLRQPASPMPRHPLLQILWLGVAYGAADGLLLSVLPVLAAWRALGGGTSRVAAGALALLASLLVTAAYHLGYPEFRGTALVGPLVGCGVVSLAYIATRSQLAAILSHAAMHVAAVLHGIDSTVQLPPHG